MPTALDTPLELNLGALGGYNLPFATATPEALITDAKRLAAISQYNKSMRTEYQEEAGVSPDPLYPFKQGAIWRGFVQKEGGKKWPYQVRWDAAQELVIAEPIGDAMARELFANAGGAISFDSNLNATVSLATATTEFENGMSPDNADITKNVIAESAIDAKIRAAVNGVLRQHKPAQWVSSDNAPASLLTIAGADYQQTTAWLEANHTGRALVAFPSTGLALPDDVAEQYSVPLGTLFYGMVQTYNAGTVSVEATDYLLEGDTLTLDPGISTESLKLHVENGEFVLLKGTTDYNALDNRPDVLDAGELTKARTLINTDVATQAELDTEVVRIDGNVTALQNNKLDSVANAGTGHSLVETSGAADGSQQATLRSLTNGDNIAIEVDGANLKVSATGLATQAALDEEVAAREAEAADQAQAISDLETVASDLQTAVDSKVSTEVHNQRAADVDNALAGKVDQTAHDTKIGELEAKDTQLQTAIDSKASTAVHNQRAADVDNALAGKVDQTAHDTKIGELEAKDTQLQTAVDGKVSTEVHNQRAVDVDNALAGKLNLDDFTPEQVGAKLLEAPCATLVQAVKKAFQCEGALAEVESTTGMIVTVPTFMW